jgi:hypothetical protein
MSIQKKRSKKKITVYVTTSELALLKHKSTSIGVNLSELLVKSGLDKEVKNRKDFDQKKYQSFLNFGNNINQIAKHLNQQGQADQELTQRLKELLVFTREILDDLR